MESRAIRFVAACGLAGAAALVLGPVRDARAQKTSSEQQPAVSAWRGVVPAPVDPRGPERRMGLVQGRSGSGQLSRGETRIWSTGSHSSGPC